MSNKIRVMTWNINSVRLRLPLALRLISDHAPDILCLQETKCPDEVFPAAAFDAQGYIYRHIHGMKGYNGVAILSRLPFAGKDIHHRCGREDCRHIVARFGGFEVHNLYIPAGGDIPDPAVNEKFAHKLAFVAEMAGWFAARYTPDAPLIALGDFNIAPLEHDVWSHRQLLTVVSHTPAEVERLARMRESLDWVDVSRHFVPADEKCYTWWSYRNRDWRKSDRGRRLDHIWVTPPLAPSLKSHAILKDVRDWDQPSDHVPVMADLVI